MSEPTPSEVHPWICFTTSGATPALRSMVPTEANHRRGEARRAFPRLPRFETRGAEIRSAARQRKPAPASDLRGLDPEPGSGSAAEDLLGEVRVADRGFVGHDPRRHVLV